ncbi:MAG: NAD-dependent epimerase/dehydratase family protein [Terracidiphilus sp.]
MLENSSRRLLVTGATGFLGAAVVHLARSQGWQVRAFSRGASEIEGVESVSGDIRDPEALRRAAAGIDAIVHAAGLAHVFGPRAKDSAAFQSVNEVGTLNVIDAALFCHVPHVVLVSSVSVYGSYRGDHCYETTPCHPEGPYASSKYAAERRAAERVSASETRLTILRLATIYGAGDRGNVARLIVALRRGRFLWIGSGSNRKSLIHKADAARACLMPLQLQRRGTEVFNVSAQVIPMREIVTSICRALDRPVPRLTIPIKIVKAAGSVAASLGNRVNLEQQIKKFTREDAYDGKLFEETFGFKPQVSLAAGLREEVMHLRDQAGL